MAGLGLIELMIAGYVKPGDERWTKVADKLSSYDYSYWPEGSLVRRICVSSSPDIVSCVTLKELEECPNSPFGEEVFRTMMILKVYREEKSVGKAWARSVLEERPEDMKMKDICGGWEMEEEEY
ncbi:hypothetical protein TrVE_jg54 [Triparma verrucosa]|uniref:Uncharacterized protein n=1 Tax=Triparma verrucosa TaxID=1606542 RepID=A0A9W7C2B1_9STRA|nr:hypothetical protein TrVE_jg54 [Triparma verrucosa]